jgi:hypothetical protein
MAAETPAPPPADGERGPGDPAERGRVRRRQRIGRVLSANPLPAIEIIGPETPEPPPLPLRELSPTRAAGLDGTLAVVVFVLAAFLASFAAINSDVWLHLSAGRLVAHGNYSFGGDPFSAAAGAVWINHAWLFDLFMYLLYQPGGAALIAAKAGLVVGLAAVLLGFRRHANAGFLPAAVTALVLLAASPFFVMRPTVASYLLFAVLLLMLHRLGAPRDSRGGAKYALPVAVGVLFLLWVNLDGGFVFGLLLLVVWTIGAVLQRAASLAESANDPGEAMQSPGTLAIALGAALVACLINPYHVRGFTLPEELAPLGAPTSLWQDEYFAHYFFDQFYVNIAERDYAAPDRFAYVKQAGFVPALATYALLAFGLVSFAINAKAWRWRRALAWAVFAWLGVSYARLVPFFAIVAGPAIVLNCQRFFGLRTAGRGRSDREALRLRIRFALIGRWCLLLGLVLLLALVWPGWVGPEPRSASPPRRVAWRVVSDQTNEHVARRFKSWYDAGELREGEARGFHYPPSVATYCAWYCPAEKGVFDLRLTAPPEAIAEWLAIVRAFHLGRGAGSPTTERPEPPDPLLKKAGITHLALAGPNVLRPPPELGGFGMYFFTQTDRFPSWAIEGRGVIAGFKDSRPRLRLDAVRRAVGEGVEPLKDEPPVPTEVNPVTIWDRYVSAPAPTPADAYEAGLWLGYREATVIHGQLMAIPLWVQLSERLRSSGLGPPTVGAGFVNVTGALQGLWRQSPEGRAGRAAGLVGVRAARQAIRANPNDSEGFVRLMQAYNVLETDQEIGTFQKITAARQAVARLVAATHRSSAERDQQEVVLQSQLYEIYSQMRVPGTQAQPLDLMRDALTRFVELRALVGVSAADNNDPEQYKANIQRERTGLEQLRTRVSENRDNWENRPKDQRPGRRALEACNYGLAREALIVLTTADAKDLDPGAALLAANLFLLVGEAESARDWITQMEAQDLGKASTEFRLHLHTLAVDAAAALGQYRSAIKEVDEVLDLLDAPAQSAARTAVAQVVAQLILPGGPQPLTQASCLPLWGGAVAPGRQPVAGALFPLHAFARQQEEWLFKQGMLALEAGDIPLAKRRLDEVAKGPPLFPAPAAARQLARHWTELWSPPR